MLGKVITVLEWAVELLSKMKKKKNQNDNYKIFGFILANKSLKTLSISSRMLYQQLLYLLSLRTF